MYTKNNKFRIPPAHPAKAKKDRDNQLEAANLVKMFELLFDPSNTALLQPIIVKQNFPDSFFYHLSPQNTQQERFRREETVVQHNK